MDSGLLRDITGYAISAVAATGILGVWRIVVRSMRTLERLLRNEDVTFHIVKGQRSVQKGLLAVIECLKTGDCDGNLDDTVKEIKDDIKEKNEFIDRAVFGKRPPEENKIGDA